MYKMVESTAKPEEIRKTSKLVGEVYGDLRCIGNYNREYKYILVCECTHCGKVYDIPASSWRHVRYCPVCKQETKKVFNHAGYRKYRQLKGVAARKGLRVDRAWETFPLFDAWWKSQGLGDKVRTKLVPDCKTIGPDTVIFYNKDE